MPRKSSLCSNVYLNIYKRFADQWHNYAKRRRVYQWLISSSVVLMVIVLFTVIINK